MYLKALTIKGFKSFADPATLRFEPGVTVVVGPNGSGKSNVVDAVAWVLGAQGPRMLRSSKMEDVIFAGSAGRPALGRAEVSLTIDNRTGKLPGGLAEITITRTLFRSGDSEYAINGQSCRLLDVQELLSDSGVGRQQHVIVSQGQLDQVLNARPEDRRAVIEEAAGVLKHRRRRERAERRLATTEENLERLGDLLREVRRQIRPLERQAVAARSHAGLAEELRALRLHLIGRELAGLEDRRARATTEREALLGEEGRLRSTVEEIDTATDQATAELSARREEDLVAALTRVQGLVERCRGLGGVLAERRRSLARALDAAADADVVSTLEAESARLAAELEATTAEAGRLAPETAEVDRAEAELAGETAAAEAAALDEAELPGDEEALAEARGRAEPLRRALERDRVNLSRLDERLTAGRLREETLRSDLADHERQGEEATSAAPELARSASSATAQAGAAAGRVAEAEETLRGAEKERHRTWARAEALAQAVAEARGAAGVDALAGLAGVIGTLSDLVEVDGGWRTAFETAAGAALASVVVESPEAARSALGRLHERSAPGAVLALAALAGPVPGSGSPDPVGGLEGRAEPVRGHVRTTVAGLGPVLDRLLVGAVAVAGGWEAAVELALDRPDLVVVTADGDRFARSGWRVRAGDSEVTPIRAAEAAEVAAAAAARAETAAGLLGTARAEAEETRSAATAAQREVERGVDRRQSLELAGGRLAAQLAALEEELAEAARHRDEVGERLERDASVLAELEERLPDLEAAAAATGARTAEAREIRRRLEERRAQVGMLRRDLEVRAAGLAERRTVLSDRLQDVERRLAGHAAQREQAADRRRRLEADAQAVERLAAMVSGRGSRLEGILGLLRERRARQLDQVRQGGARLESLRERRNAADQRLGEVRERHQRLELELVENGVRQEGAVESLRRELGADPAEALAAPLPQLPEGVGAADRVAVVEKELDALGPVNPLALEELSSLEERHTFLEDQVEDVRKARRELQQVIRAVDEEIVRVFAEAFADVNEHFQGLIGALFPGGGGRLTLTDPVNLLETGVEVEARPAGKNVRKLSLLSGGERSLVALAFLFAVFRSRPSPFYLLDEVEAALDDVNLHRFLDLLHEFRDEAQLIIVSHQKRTMEAADALYGVTMQAGGSSKVISQKVRRDPEPDPDQ